MIFGFEDPPKAISDIVEAVFGAVHVDGGFSAGQRGVLHLMAPIFKVLLKARNEGKEISLKHPKKVMQELGGDLFELSSSRESDFFAIHANRSTDILCDKKWNKAHPDGGNFVATVELLGSTMLAVSDPSATVGRNRACYLITNTLQTKPELLAQLHAVRTKVERGVYLAAHSTEASEKNDETD